MTHHVKAKIDEKHQNSRCGDRDETINHIIRERSKLAQKEYRTRHDWVGKVIHWELCKEFKFDHMTNPENEMHKILWDFEIQPDNQITTRLSESKKKKKKKKNN